MTPPDSVRLALPAEATDIARLQRRSWAKHPALRAGLAGLSADDTTRVWHEAIVRPPMAHFRVMVALGSGSIVGFCALGPSEDPDADPSDGMIHEFVVDEADVSAGHSSRLLNAAVDTLRADGYEVAVIWIPSDADVLREFLLEAGWGADGAHREVGVDDDSPSLKLIRLHTLIG
ncbi:MAG: GNAT family N-acetyltransferase [Arachnia sp.]